MLEIFKEIISEISIRARIAILIGIFIFFSLCVWSCMCAIAKDKHDQTYIGSIEGIGRNEVFIVG